jgi:hypothetical protein
MKHLKKFLENLEEDDYTIIRVKHLIEYLSKFDPEMEVILDKDGWEDGQSNDPIEIIEHSGLFYEYSFDGESHLTIQN